MHLQQGGRGRWRAGSAGCAACRLESAPGKGRLSCENDPTRRSLGLRLNSFGIGAAALLCYKAAVLQDAPLESHLIKRTQQNVKPVGRVRTSSAAATVPWAARQASAEQLPAVDGATARRRPPTTTVGVARPQQRHHGRRAARLPRPAGCPGPRRRSGRGRTAASLSGCPIRRAGCALKKWSAPAGWLSFPAGWPPAAAAVAAARRRRAR